MRTIKVLVDKEKANYLERVNYELMFTKDIIQRLIELHPDDPNLINSATFKAYQRQGSELQAEYSLLCSEFEEKYVPASVKGHKFNWIIYNNSNEMNINILCDCEIEGIE